MASISLKRNYNHKSHSSEDLKAKRICTAASIAAAKISQRAPTIEQVLTISEDAVWSLRKSDLRTHFLTLQQWTRSLSNAVPRVESGADIHDDLNEIPSPQSLPHSYLGSEKRKQKPDDFEAEARLIEVTKGIKKLRKWLAGADIQSLRIGWQEPPQTYTLEQKKDILDGLRALKAVKVEAGHINWG
ncbi:hypothetical protein H4I95_03577 [Botrytis cinerea]